MRHSLKQYYTIFFHDHITSYVCEYTAKQFDRHQKYIPDVVWRSLRWLRSTSLVALGLTLLSFLWKGDFSGVPVALMRLAEASEG